MGLVFDLEDPAATPRIRVLTDGKAGTQSQAIGLAEALGLEPEIKQVAIRPPWRWLSPGVRLGIRYAWDDSGPPPALIISAGRSGAVASLACAARGDRGFRIHIQNPRVGPRNFDLVIAPMHDRISGANVLKTLGSLHRISDKALAAAKAEWRDLFEPMAAPRIAALIGGSSRTHRMTAAAASRLGSELAALAQASGGSILATASRRTPAAQAATIRRSIEQSGWMWNGAGDNPYLGMLAWADHILVTADSVSMASEAMATGKPIAIYDLPGGSERFARFHQALIAAGRARWFDGSIDGSSRAPLNETELIAARIAPLLRSRGIAVGAKPTES